MLGIVLAPYGKIPGSYPYGVTQSWGGNGVFLCPDDPQFNTQGEAGYYYDTPLGSAKPGLFAKLRGKLGLGRIPTDFELASKYGFTPTYSGWVATNRGYYTPAWEPPDGYYPGYPPPVQPLDGLRGAPAFVPDGVTAAAAAADTATPVTVDDVIAQMNAHNDRIFALTIVSTTAVAVSALVTMLRTLKLIRSGG
jgi:hypothetical protein